MDPIERGNFSIFDIEGLITTKYQEAQVMPEFRTMLLVN